MLVRSTWLARVLGVPALDRVVLQRALQALVLIAGALGVWWLSLPGINPSKLGDYGLISALPPLFFLALALLAGGFAWALREQRPSVLLLTLYTVALNVVLRATPALIYDEARYSWVYKHVGLVNYIRLHGAVDPLIDAYHNWPGFFALGALFTDAAGFSSPTDFMAWSQLFFNLLYLGPLLLIFRALTHDRRLIWTGTWFFFLGNWVGQDYFAPQAFAYFLFLVIVAVVLTGLRSERGARMMTSDAILRDPALDSGDGQAAVPAAAPVGRGAALLRQTGLTLLVLVLFAPIAASHQLTPFMLVAGLGALALFGQLRVLTLPLWLLGLTLAWNSLFASTFLAGHSDWHGSLNLGEVLGNFTKNVNRPSAPSSGGGAVQGRSLILVLTQAYTLLVWGLAALGVLRRWHARRWDWAPVLLAAAPFPVILVQSYGGEMMLRVYLFSLPFMAFLAASGIFPSSKARSSTFTLIATAGLSLVMLGGLLIAHFGNEKSYYITRGEVDTARFLYRDLPSGSLLVYASHNFPDKIAGDYNRYQVSVLTDDYQLSLSKSDGSDFRLGDLERFLKARKVPAFLIFSQSDKAYVEAFGLLPRGAVDSVERRVRTSGDFKLVFRTSSSRVYALKSSLAYKSGLGARP